MKIPVDVAILQISLTELASPTDGVVVAAASLGAQLAPGAPVVTIRATAPSTVTAWLAPAQWDQICPGDSADITGDWMAPGDGVAATVSTISPTAEYPPTSTTTDEVHLTRAIEVTIQATAPLPPGLPVQISIDGCHAAAGHSTTNR
jgi:multidrug resistance efflux pump